MGKDALCFLPPYPHCGRQVHSLTDFRTHFFRIPAYAEDQLRHSALWTELDSWTLHLEKVIVGLAGSQSVRHVNKFYIDIYRYKIHRDIHLISSVSLAVLINIEAVYVRLLCTMV